MDLYFKKWKDVIVYDQPHILFLLEIDKITEHANDADITDLSDSDYVQDKGYVDNELDVYARVLDPG